MGWHGISDIKSNYQDCEKLRHIWTDLAYQADRGHYKGWSDTFLFQKFSPGRAGEFFT